MKKIEFLFTVGIHKEKCNFRGYPRFKNVLFTLMAQGQNGIFEKFHYKDEFLPQISLQRFFAFITKKFCFHYKDFYI